MDSKLRCVFVEGEPREPAPEQESTQAAPDTQERVKPYFLDNSIDLHDV